MLRGINIGASRRVAMADLRALLGEAGYADVQTYVQSGNVVLSTSESAAALERDAQRLISQRFGFDVPVVARSAPQLAAVVKRNPLGAAAAGDPKRYQVSFLSRSGKLSAEQLAALAAVATDSERFVAHGRELYSWHPDGVARSKLANALAATGLGVTVTARNWTTVTKLLEMARG
jgi:uncharacterized protein (DUF1697 family)